MSAETTSHTKPTRRSLKRLLGVLGLLLVVAVAVNGATLLKIARGERSLRSVVYGLTERPENMIVGWRLPPDTGSEKAKVTVEVFLTAGEPCHAQTMLLGRALGTLDPARVRVRFMDAHQPQARQRSDKLRIGCDQGLAINGRTKFQNMDQKQGKQETIMMNHQGGGMAPDMLYRLLNAELQAAYKGQGLPMNVDEFEARMQAETKRFETLELALARARQAGQENGSAQ